MEGETLAGLRQQHDRVPDPGDSNPPLTVLAIVSSLKTLPDCLLFGKLTPVLRESKELVLLSLSGRCPTKHTFWVLKNLGNNTLLCIQGFIFFLLFTVHMQIKLKYKI